MSATTTSHPACAPAHSGLLTGNEMGIECYGNEDAHQDSNFFRGILVAVPAGLAMWVGLLKLAAVIAHHI